MKKPKHTNWNEKPFILPSEPINHVTPEILMHSPINQGIKENILFYCPKCRRKFFIDINLKDNKMLCPECLALLKRD